jgi:hypothetical protein
MEAEGNNLACMVYKKSCKEKLKTLFKNRAGILGKEINHIIHFIFVL